MDLLEYFIVSLYGYGKDEDKVTPSLILFYSSPLTYIAIVRGGITNVNNFRTYSP